MGSASHEKKIEWQSVFWFCFCTKVDTHIEICFLNFFFQTLEIYLKDTSQFLRKPSQPHETSRTLDQGTFGLTVPLLKRLPHLGATSVV